MWTLEQPWTPRRTRILADTPFALIAALGVGWLMVAGLTAGGWLAAPVLRIVAITAAHGGLLAVALAWGAADRGAPFPPRILLITVGLVGVGATAAAVDARAAVIALAAPAWLALLASRGRLVGLGVGPGIPLRPVFIGAAIGALLGGHLLLSASQTLGYPVRGWSWKALLALWGYDVAVNVVAAECFFRGALFNRLQRRWSFAAAAALATGASLLRYLADPLVPKSIEAIAGLLFYLTVLGTVNCWLLSWSGSLVPGLIASLLFFIAYRALAFG